MTLQSCAILVLCLTISTAQNLFTTTIPPSNEYTTSMPVFIVNKTTMPVLDEMTIPTVDEKTVPTLDVTTILKVDEIVTNPINASVNYEDREENQESAIQVTEPPKHITNSYSVTPRPNTNCADIKNGDSYTQAEFLDYLTDPCRYDKLTRPSKKVGPDNIHVQIDIRHIEAEQQLQFKMHMLLQFRYIDTRLAYQYKSPQRTTIIGEDLLRSKLWVPHVLLENEKDSLIMGHDSRDIYMSISPAGEVTYSKRIKSTLYCWMDLQKFPFDDQTCEIGIQSWTYNASELLLHWEQHEPVFVANQLHLTEYSLVKHWTEESTKQTSRQTRGAFAGNYSCLIFKFQMQREMGFYMLEYFIPSIMLVCTSWVSFWLDQDASAPRITLGTSTMLSFITLATAQTRTLPKVSYIKASEIWFLGCTIFIFMSMVEFAFVNIIWRRKANVELKKVNSKNILKCTLTPKLARKELLKHTEGLQKSHSCSSLVNANPNAPTKRPYNSYLTVHSFSSGTTLPKITTESVDDLVMERKSDCVSIDISDHDEYKSPTGWTTMTPQEISQWIDRRSRLVFPCAFIIFNAFYWCFVYWV